MDAAKYKIGSRNDSRDVAIIALKTLYVQH